MYEKLNENELKETVTEEIETIHDILSIKAKIVNLKERLKIYEAIVAEDEKFKKVETIVDEKTVVTYDKVAVKK